MQLLLGLLEWARHLMEQRHDGLEALLDALQSGEDEDE